MASLGPVTAGSSVTDMLACLSLAYLPPPPCGLHAPAPAAATSLASA
jgi:hypothetical protein